MAANDVSAVARALSALPSLAGLDLTILEAIARAAARRDCEPGQVVFLEGEPCTGLHIVQEGWLKSVKASPSGREQIVRVVGPGEVFNEVGVFAGSPNPVTIVALEKATLWVLPREAVLHLLDQHPALSLVILQNLAQRAQYLLGLVEDLSLRPVESRLARFLLQQPQGGPRRRWITQAEMASRLGTVPEVLNRALRNLAGAGLIEINRHQITILNRRGLEERARPSQ